MKDLKDFFTININSRIFVPTIKEDKICYHIEYKSNIFGELRFAVTKSSYMKASKITIQNDIYDELKIRGIC